MIGKKGSERKEGEEKTEKKRHARLLLLRCSTQVVTKDCIRI